MKLLVSCFAILEFDGSRGVGSVLVMWWCLLSLLCVKLWCMLAAKYILSRNIVPCGIMISYLVILSELYVLSVHRTKSLIVRFLVIYGCLFVIWYFIKKKQDATWIIVTRCCGLPQNTISRLRCLKILSTRQPIFRTGVFHDILSFGCYQDRKWKIYCKPSRNVSFNMAMYGKRWAAVGRATRKVPSGPASLRWQFKLLGIYIE